MLGPHAECDEARRQSAQDREPLHQPRKEWHLHAAAGCGERWRDDAVLQEDPDGLRRPGLSDRVKAWRATWSGKAEPKPAE
jgi:hypothetical protein